MTTSYTSKWMQVGRGNRVRSAAGGVCRENGTAHATAHGRHAALILGTAGAVFQHTRKTLEASRDQIEQRPNVWPRHADSKSAMGIPRNLTSGDDATGRGPMRHGMLGGCTLRVWEQALCGTIKVRKGSLRPTAGARDKERTMSNHVYKLVELVGSSTSSTDDAIRQAVATAAKTLRHLDWFEVIETRGNIVEGKVAHFQVTLKAGFRLED
jgi:flavin-binding protein dodecin